MNTESNTHTSLLKVKSDLLSQIDELKRDVEAVDRLLSRHIPLNGKGNAGDSKQTSLVKSPYSVDSYSEAKTWKQKVYFIVKEIGKGDADDVAKKLAQHEKDIDEVTAKKNATLYLSILYGAGAIKADKTGKKYKYSV